MVFAGCHDTRYRQYFDHLAARVSHTAQPKRSRFLSEVMRPSPGYALGGLVTLLVLLFAILERSYRRRSSAVLVSERDRLEERILQRTADLSREERNFRELIEAAPDAIIVSDRSGRIVKVNSESARLFGYDRRRLVGADIRMVMPDPSGVQKPEPFGLRSDGRQFPIDIRVGSLESEQGPLTVGIIRDVSEREEAYRVERGLLHDLGERVKELTALHAVARLLNASARTPDVLSRIVELLPAAWQYPDVTAARIAVGGYDVCTTGFAHTRWVQRAEIVTPGNEVGIIEVVYLDERPPEADGPFLAEERSLIDSLAGLLQSYFERLHAEEDRVRLARAEAAALVAREATRAKDQFLATLSHELRAPLNVMLGWTKMLSSGQLDQGATTRGLNVLDRSVQLQARLIEDLLDVSRIVTGKLRLERQRIDLASVVGAAVDAARIAARAKNIELRSAVDTSLSIDADPARLQQIISNLLTNALKFTASNGTVEVGVDRIGTSARIIVKDNGIGMAPELVPFVFERFRQGDSSTWQSSHKGLGLGLAIVKHLVDLHGGQIQAASAGLGEGSTFTVTLPLAPESVPAVLVNAAPASGSLLAGIRVLVVDDDADARLTLTTLLEQFGAATTAVASVDEAVANLNRQHADVLLSDLANIDEEASEMIRKVRVNNSAAVLPAVALSVYAGGDRRLRAIEAGFQEHLVKPVEPAMLAETLARLVRRL
jgi:signal transduction histidine kinase/PAS domain-containing protein